MKTVNVEVMVYQTPGDGNCYDDEIEIKDEDYAVLRKYFRNNECEDIYSEDIEDLKVRNIVERIENQSLDELEEDSYDGYESDEENEEFDEWYDKFTKTVHLIWEEPEEHNFTINISNGGESEIDFNVYEDELELIQEADENSESYDEVDGLEDFYKDIMEAVKIKLEEDLDLTGDDPKVLDELWWSVTLND